MPYGRQAIAKPLVTRKARPDGEDIDPPTEAAIRTALAKQNTSAGMFVNGSPSKRTIDALARAMAEESIREGDAPTLTQRIARRRLLLGLCRSR